MDRQGIEQAADRQFGGLLLPLAQQQALPLGQHCRGGLGQQRQGAVQAAFQAIGRALQAQGPVGALLVQAQAHAIAPRQPGQGTQAVAQGEEVAMGRRAREAPTQMDRSRCRRAGHRWPRETPGLRGEGYGLDRAAPQVQVEAGYAGGLARRIRRDQQADQA